ncbi:hypothetical protein STSP2_02538 [Anaerohalosphaera lusitana]|uniref:Uncharacterized protein n=1 Tax=Anaerohalosphaera lusitana TaxID=1936003 RepID=A0A1U9NN76_9BACT|nr:hypothetical protein STSP2_02538 [Anaerohalosphaera lusitana]
MGLPKQVAIITRLTMLKNWILDLTFANSPVDCSGIWNNRKSNATFAAFSQTLQVKMTGMHNASWTRTI